jgi:hypothetical protein
MFSALSTEGYKPPAGKAPVSGCSSGDWASPCSTHRHRWWQLPAPPYTGSTSIRGTSIHFGKVGRPDGVMLQLGQRSSERDVWLWVPSGTSHNQASPWISALGLSQWRESDELNFVEGWAAGDMQFLPASPDFIRHFPHMSAVDARQHPQQGQLLDPDTGGGGGGGGEDSGGNGAGGGSSRPSSGLLWPRCT